jgi:hypothetical protein
MKIIFTDRRHLLALICVLTIFASTCALWWFILVGGNPYHPGGLRIYNRDGIETYQFKQGDWVVLRRQYVSIARSSLNSYQRFTTRQDARWSYCLDPLLLRRADVPSAVQCFKSL